MKIVVLGAGIIGISTAWHLLARGIAHYFTDQKSFDAAGDAAALMRKYGVARQVVSRDALLKIEPAFTSFGEHIVGGTFTASDESGDARVFTQALAQCCIAKGAELVFGHDVVRLDVAGNAINSIAICAHDTRASGLNDSKNATPATPATLRHLKADAFVVACGAHTAPHGAGSGKALAELISAEKPEMAFGFYGLG